MTTYFHRYADITVGETGVTIENSSGALTFASIVHAERDNDGRIIEAMLDRRVHDDHTGYRGADGTWSMTGCFATQMTLNREMEHEERVATRDMIRGFVERVVEADGVPRYKLCTEITDHILAQHGPVGFWSRAVHVDELAAWIVCRLDDGDVANLDLLGDFARRIVGMCKVHLG